jgi:hypothetical protein
MVLLACLLVGASMAIAGVRPPSLARSLPEQVMTAWLILVAVGGGVGLVGAYWRGTVDDALLIEFAGVMAIAAACTLYVVALFALNPLSTAIGAAGLLAGIAAGAWFRAVQCVLDRRRVRGGVVSTVGNLDGDLPVLVEPERDQPSGDGS